MLKLTYRKQSQFHVNRIDIRDFCVELECCNYSGFTLSKFKDFLLKEEALARKHSKTIQYNF